MPTTARGLYYADGAASPNPIAISTSEANSGQTALDALALGEATPRFATTTARDAAYAAFPLALANGMMCSVDGEPMVYGDSTHRSPAGWYLATDGPYTERYGTPGQTPTINIWTAVTGFTTISETNNPDTGPYFTAATDGFTVNKSGQYRLDCYINWSGAATTGSRYITASNSATNAGNGGAGGMFTGLLLTAAMPSKAQSFSRELRMNAGQKASVYAYTTVSDTIGYATFRIRRTG